MLVDAWSFEGETIHPSGRLLDAPSELEILPIAFGESREGARLEGTLRCEDGTAYPIAQVAPVFVDDDDLRGEPVFDALARRVRVDLAPWTGRRVSVLWKLRDGDRPLAGALGMPALRRTARPGAGSAAPSKPRPEAEPPPILMICSDTHRLDHAFGDAGKRLMPALQALRGESVVYTRAFSNSSWTLPSVASTFTGLFPRYHATGFRRGEMPREEFDAEGPPPGCFGFTLGEACRLLTVYPRQLDTATEILRAGGYRTAMVASNPLYTLSGIAGDGQDVVVRTGVVPWQEVNAAVRALIARRTADRPFFLLVHYMDVHQWKPWYYQKSRPGGNAAEDPEGVRAAYAAAVRDCDAGLDELLALWSREVGLERSLVVFYSDHGEHLLAGERPRLGHGNSQEEELLHVPLLVRYPDAWEVPPGEIEQPVSLCDLFPTLLEAAGISHGGRCDGARLPLSRDGRAVRRFFADSQLYGDEMASVREGPFKLIVNFADESRTLVDLAPAAASEGSPASERGAIEKRLIEAYEAYRADAEARTRDLATERTVDPETAREGMEQLGYAR